MINNISKLLSVAFLTLFISYTTYSQYSVKSLVGKYNESDVFNELIRREAQQNKSFASDSVLHTQNKKLAKYQSDTLYKYIKVLYGDDDRHNIYEPLITPELQNDAEQVACLINKNQIKNNKDGTYSLVVEQLFGEAHGLCDDESFINEPVVAFCSGFAVSPKIFVTAGHCIDITNFSNMRIVYGFKMKSKLKANLTIEKEDIYEPVKIIARELEGTTNDFSLIEIKQTFPNNRIASTRQSGFISENEKIHIIGHPSGLPLKITLNANVLNNKFSNYFVINSDTYQGNSGSPVFNSNTHIVEGILVRGEKDFRYIRLNNCYGSVRCPKDMGTCRGEDVSRVSQFINLVNNQ